MSEQLSQNALVGSMGAKSMAIVGFAQRLPLSFWRGLVIIVAVFWIVRSAAQAFWLVFPIPEAPQPSQLAMPLESGPENTGPAVSFDAIASLGDAFGAAPEEDALGPTPTPPPVEVDTTVTTKLNLKLHGVFAASQPERGSAIIADGSKQVLYAVGDEIDSNRGVKLARVLDKRVILDNKGNLESLWLFSEEDFSKQVVSSRPDPIRRSRPSPQELSDNAVRTTARPDQIPKNIGDVVRFSVHREGGQMVGYRIRPGRDRELFNQVGLKANDIVTSVNGIEVNDPKQIRSVYKSMKTATEAQLTVLRGGETHSITISLDSDA